MMKHEIEIPDLPEGWKAVAYRVPSKDEYTLSDDGIVVSAKLIKFPVLIVEKIRPRSRIILEETEENSNPAYWQRFEIGDHPIFLECDKKLREVKEGEE